MTNNDIIKDLRTIKKYCKCLTTKTNIQTLIEKIPNFKEAKVYSKEGELLVTLENVHIEGIDL